MVGCLRGTFGSPQGGPFDLSAVVGPGWKGEEQVIAETSEQERKRPERQEIGEEEGSWPRTYAASRCQASLAQATHTYAALLLLLALRPSPTHTPWHYLVKQSWRDDSGKRQGLPSLSTARTGWQNTV